MPLNVRGLGCLVVIGCAHFLSDNRDTTFDGLLILGVRYPNTFMTMFPGLCEPREEVLARNDPPVAGFESLLQRLAGDRQILEPKP